MTTVIITVLFYLVLVLIIAARKNPKALGRSFQELKDTFLKYFEEETDVEPSKVIKKVQPSDTSFYTETRDELSLVYEDDIILKVDRSLSSRSIKDPRSMFSKKNIRQGIIVSEILNKPKSMRK